ncbi:MAG: polyprenyl synthetase family protein [Thermoanaerobacteraceae bacterium]|nr:polyprenyl synthetase family protein [Thermoanaerobacteraceae bacterium]
MIPDHFQELIRPAMVLLSARLFGPLNTPLIALAAVIQFIYLASRVHQNVREAGGPATGDPRDGYQFPVLVGDYLYGRFFTSLCDYGIVRYLESLSRVICEINEGGILRLQNNQNNPDLVNKIVYKETAALMGTGCGLAAHLAGAPEQEQQELTRYGVNLGMALGLQEYPDLRRDINAHLDKAAATLTQLPPGEARDALKLIAQHLRHPAETALELQVV